MGCYLTIVSCVKDEEDYIEDFVKYHRFVGVQKFIFFDRHYNKVKDIFKYDDDVEVIHFPEPQNHTQAWEQGIIRTQHQSFWTAFIDIDQVLVPVKCDSLPAVLENYQEFASLQVNWHTFGPSGQETKTKGSVYERFLMRAEDHFGVNNHTQSIVQPLLIHVHPWGTPHHAPVKHGVSVNENKNHVSGPFSIPPSQNIIWCGHYYTKSKEEWLYKVSKGRADVQGVHIPTTDFDLYKDTCNVVKELRVLELWEKAKINHVQNIKFRISRLSKQLDYLNENLSTLEAKQ